VPFAHLGLSEPIVNGVERAGYQEPTPIQQEAIPPILEGKDVIATAQTGTGKTAAFVLPVLERLARVAQNPNSKKKGPRCLVLAPTRELALAACSTTWAAGTCASTTSRSWCSTRPTACSIWAFCPTSGGS